jgi:TetR/AcrR family transcriptional regulator
MSTPNTEAPTRKRPKPGERRVQILQALATLLEQPGGERITTDALAAHLEVSEAALYRQFASKAQMFEGLIDFIESSVFGLLRQLSDMGLPPRECAQRQVAMLLQFAEKNPGLARVMVGDALVLENERLQQRINLFFDKFEAALRQTLRQTQDPTAPVTSTATTAEALATQVENSAPNPAPSPAPMLVPDSQAQALAAVLTAFCLGQLQRFVRSGFRKSPAEHWAPRMACLFGS